MKLQDGGRHLRGDWAEERFFQNFGFVLAVCHHHNTARRHNSADSHRVGRCRYLLKRGEEALVGAARDLQQFCLVRGAREVGVRLIKSNVAVMPDPKQLKIDPAPGADLSS